ncbi:hypothetical protein [Oceanobacillus picturae]|uniref:hypothetical protein n=1 Tax=Oceanobacillus picturae TaxID=171693 RepID=UPI0036284AC5
MINLFKMDFHRFVRNKTMYLLLLIYSAFQIFGVFMMSLYEEPMAETGTMISEMNASEFIQSVLSQTPSWMLLYIMVFTIYFYISELNSGYYKNYITMKHARIHSVVSKIIMQAFFTLLMLATLIISDFIGRSLFLDNSSIGDLGFFMKLLSSQFLLQWSFSVLILCVAIITKKMLVSLIVGFVFALNIFGMILSSLESVLFDKAYVTDYLLVNTIMRIKDFNDLNELIVVLSIGLGSLIIFITIATTYKLKEDLK